MDIFREFAEDSSGIYFSGLPVLHDVTTPAPPGCFPLPDFTYSDGDSSVHFEHWSGSYMAYNISGQEGSLAYQYVHGFYVKFYLHSELCNHVVSDLF